MVKPLNRTHKVVDKSIFSSKTHDKIQKCAKMTKSSTIQTDLCPDRRICAFTCSSLLNLDVARREDIIFTECPLYDWKYTAHFRILSHLRPEWFFKLGSVSILQMKSLKFRKAKQLGQVTQGNPKQGGI